MNRLLEECLDALALDVTVLSSEEGRQIEDAFIKMFPLTKWGRIHWEEYDKQIFVGYSLDRIIPAIEKLLKKSINTSIYIIWSDGDTPVLKTNISSVINHFDDVTCLSSRQYLVNLSEKYVIEIHRDGYVVVGISPKI